MEEDVGVPSKDPKLIAQEKGKLKVSCECGVVVSIVFSDHIFLMRLLFVVGRVSAAEIGPFFEGQGAFSTRFHR